MKYDRVDPAELQNLKDEITKLQAELATAQEQIKEKDGVRETERARVSTLLLSPSGTVGTNNFIDQ